MGHHNFTVMKTLAILVPALVLATTVRGIDFFHDLAGPRSESETTGHSFPKPTVFEPRRPFVIGRDNLGFPNPTGAVAVAGMAGNCYTMAFVSRMFYERAHFQDETPPSRRTGVSLDEVSRALQSDAPFSVYGYDSLYSMTSAPSIPARRLDSWMDAKTRYRLGVASKPPAEEAPPNADDLVAMYELVTTIHYLHYLQNQLSHFVESAATQALGDRDTAGRVSVRTVEQMGTELRNGRLPLLLLYDPTITYGHVVLAYRIVRHGPDAGGADVADVYIYDSNIHYGDRLFESILRVDMTSGRYRLWRQPAEGEPLEPDNRYANSTWFSSDHACLILLPCPNVDSDERERLAMKLRKAREETGYLFVAGDFIRRTTTMSPDDSSLFEDTREFIVNLERVQDHLGIDPPFRTQRLPETADVGTLNRYLATNSDAAIRTIFPYALPPGIFLSDTAIRFDDRNPNTAHVATTLDLDKEVALEEVLAALEQSALFTDRNDLADLVRTVGETFAGQKLSATVELRLRKEPCTIPTIGPYAPNPTLLKSHVIIGDLPPRQMTVPGDHIFEIGGDLLGAMTHAILESQGVLNKRYEFSYDFTVIRTFQRRGYAVLQSIRPEASTRGLVVAMAARGFAPVATSSRGVNFSSQRTAGTIALELCASGERNQVVVSSTFEGDLALSGGLTRLGNRIVFGSLLGLAERIFPFFAGGIEEFIEAQLHEWIILDPNSSIRISDIDLSSSRISFALDPFTVDADRTIHNLLGHEARARIRSIGSTEDRLILVLDND